MTPRIGPCRPPCRIPLVLVDGSSVGLPHYTLWFSPCARCPWWIVKVSHSWSVAAHRSRGAAWRGRLVFKLWRPLKDGASSASHLTTGLPSAAPSSVASSALSLGILPMPVRVATRLTDSNLPLPRSARAWLDVCVLLFIGRLLSMRRNALLKVQGGHSLMRAVVVGVAWSPALLLTLSALRCHIMLLLGSSHGLQVSSRGLKCLIVPLSSM
jgi:hypothetical protein